MAGTLIAVMVAMIAQLLFGRPLWTFVAGLLIALDGLNVVMSRVAMLDIHLAFWVVLGFLSWCWTGDGSTVAPNVRSPTNPPRR